MSESRALTAAEIKDLRGHLTELDRDYPEGVAEEFKVKQETAKAAVIEMTKSNPNVLSKLHDSSKKKIGLIIGILSAIPKEKQLDCFKVALSTCKTPAAFEKILAEVDTNKNITDEQKSELIKMCAASLTETAMALGQILAVINTNGTVAEKEAEKEKAALIKMCTESLTETAIQEIHSASNCEKAIQLLEQLEPATQAPIQNEVLRKELLEKTINEFYDTQEDFHQDIKVLLDHFFDKKDGVNVLKEDHKFMAEGELNDEQRSSLKYVLDRFQQLEANPFGKADVNEEKALKHLSTVITDQGSEFTQMMQALRECTILNKSITNFITEINASFKKIKKIDAAGNDKSMDLSAYLIKPLQRLIKYKDLLVAMEKTLPGDTGILEAKKIILKKAEAINEEENALEEKSKKSTMSLKDSIEYVKGNTLREIRYNMELEELKSPLFKHLSKLLILNMLSVSDNIIRIYSYALEQLEHPGNLIRMKKAEKIIEVLKQLSQLETSEKMISYLNELLQNKDKDNALNEHTKIHLQEQPTTLRILIQHLANSIMPTDTLAALEKIETRLSDDSSRQALERDSDQLQKLTAQYQQLIVNAAEELREVSQYQFQSIEDKDLGDTTEVVADKPQTIRDLTKTSSALINHVMSDIIFSGNQNKQMITMERWIGILQQSFLNGDMPSVESILVALKSPEITQLGLINNISNQAKNIFDHLLIHPKQGPASSFAQNADITVKLISNRRDRVIPLLEPYARTLFFGKGKIKTANGEIENNREKISLEIICSYTEKENFSKISEFQSLTAEREKALTKKNGAKDVLKNNIPGEIEKNISAIKLLLPELEHSSNSNDKYFKILKAKAESGILKLKSLVAGEGYKDKDDEYFQMLFKTLEDPDKLAEYPSNTDEMKKDEEYFQILFKILKDPKNEFNTDEREIIKALLYLTKEKIYNQKLSKSNEEVKSLNNQLAQLRDDFFSELGPEKSKKIKNEIANTIDRANRDQATLVKEQDEKINTLTTALIKLKSNLDKKPNTNSFTPFQKKLLSGTLLQHSPKEIEEQLKQNQKSPKKLTIESFETFAIVSESSAIATVAGIQRLFEDKQTIITNISTDLKKAAAANKLSKEREELKKYLTTALKEITTLETSSSYSEIVLIIDKQLQSKPKLSYDLVLMSALENNTHKTEKGKIYLSQDGTYVVHNFEEKIFKGTINTHDIDLKDLDAKIKDYAFRKKILEATSKAGHTQPIDEATHMILANILLGLGKLKKIYSELDIAFNEISGKGSRQQLAPAQLLKATSSFNVKEIKEMHKISLKNLPPDTETQKRQRAFALSNLSKSFHVKPTKQKIIERTKTAPPSTMKTIAASSMTPPISAETKSTASTKTELPKTSFLKRARDLTKSFSSSFSSRLESITSPARKRKKTASTPPSTIPKPEAATSTVPPIAASTSPIETMPSAKITTPALPTNVTAKEEISKDPKALFNQVQNTITRSSSPKTVIEQWIKDMADENNKTPHDPLRVSEIFDALKSSPIFNSFRESKKNPLSKDALESYNKIAAGLGTPHHYDGPGLFDSPHTVSLKTPPLEKKEVEANVDDTKTTEETNREIEGMLEEMAAEKIPPKQSSGSSMKVSATAPIPPATASDNSDLRRLLKGIILSVHAIAMGIPPKSEMINGLRLFQPKQTHAAELNKTKIPTPTTKQP